MTAAFVFKQNSRIVRGKQKDIAMRKSKDFPLGLSLQVTE